MNEYKFVQEEVSTRLGTEGSILIPKKIYDTLIPAAQKTLIPRSLAAIYIGPAQIPGSSIDLNLVTPDSMQVRVVGEGAEIWQEELEFTESNIKPTKYGLRVNITREMMEDSQFNLLAQHVEMAGREFAENETSLILTALQGCTNSVSGGAAITIANLTSGMLNVENADYQPTDLLIGNEVLSDIRNIDTFVEANKLGSREMIQTGFVGVLYGLNVWRFSTNAAPSTTYAKYAYIIDKNYSYVIVEKRPISVEYYTLETHDAEGVAITQRLAVARLRDTATCRISTS